MQPLDNLFEALKLDHLAQQVDALLEQAAKKDLGYREMLTEALTCEWQGRKQKGTETRLAHARLPWLKTLEQFDFTFQPSIDRKVVRELGTLGFVGRAENVVLLGPPGVGKTHLAIGLAVKAAQGDILVFQNSDVVPLHQGVLSELLDPLHDPEVSATFARQVPRPEAHSWVRGDYAVRLPERGPAPNWITLSLPLAAIRREALERHPFYTEAWASEDTEWGVWARDHGLRVEYVAEAVVMHSHNYTLRQIFGRRFVEGEADAFIYGGQSSAVKVIPRALKSALADLLHEARAGRLPRPLLGLARRLVFHVAHHRGHRLGEKRIAERSADVGVGQRAVLSRYSA